MLLRALPSTVLVALSLLAACASDGDDVVVSHDAPGEAEFREAQGVWSRDPQLALSEYRAAAELGFTPAFMRLAEISLNGEGGLPVDHEQAVHWLRLAAESGNAEAHFGLGVEFWFGRGVEEDPAAAVEHWRVAADAGYASAQANLASAYFTGRGVEADRVEAARWALMAAEHGDAGGQVKIGLFYANGWGVAQDVATARRWLYAAANQDEPDALDALGRYALEGIGTRADPVEAAEWFSKAMQLGSTDAADSFGSLDAAMRAAAERGESEGQRYVGRAFLAGLGVPRDARTGFAWLARAAEQDDPRALLDVARRHGEGLGTPEDDQLAADACRRAAALGDAEGLYEYGVLIEDLGRYEADSHAEARSCFEAAAARGHAAAQFLVSIESVYAGAFAGDVDDQAALGRFFTEHPVLRPDYDQAVHWFGRAADGYDIRSRLDFGRLLLRGGETATVLGVRTRGPDVRAAVEHLTVTASVGNTEARVLLARLHADTGSGVYDLQKAMDWVDLAAVGGDTSAVPFVQAAYDAAYDAAQREEREAWASVPRESDPFTPSPCGFCGGSGTVLQARGQFINGHWWPDTYTTCLECNGTGLLFH